jgi:hypothetical protein
MTLKERLEDNSRADQQCYYCGKELFLNDIVLIWEDHEDGTYCSEECLDKEARNILEWNDGDY